MISRVFRRLNIERVKLGNKAWHFLTKHISFLRVFYETKGTLAEVTLKIWFFQKVLCFNRNAYWPVHYRSTINVYKNIYVGVGSAPGLSPGCYIQGIGKIYIGDYTGIGPNVGIVSSNHQLIDLRKYQIGEVHIGNYCWIGMNSTILPDVVLGNFTIVQAGSVVKQSFADGYCIIGGNPATIIKKFPLESHHLFAEYKNKYEYHGYIRKERFTSFRSRNLWN